MYFAACKRYSLTGSFYNVTLLLSTKKLSTKRKAHSTCSVQFRLQRIITSLSLRIQMSKNACLTGFCRKTFMVTYMKWIAAQIAIEISRFHIFWIYHCECFLYLRNCCNICDTSRQNTSIYIIHIALLLHCVLQISHSENGNVECISYIFYFV